MSTGRRRTAWVWVALGVLGVVWSSHVAAQDPASADAEDGLDLEWHAVEGCASEEEIRSEVARLIGGDNPAARGIRVQGEITGEPGALQLVVSMETPQGAAQRALRGQGCETLCSAGALVIAMAIDPEHAMQRAGEIEAEPTPEPRPLSGPHALSEPRRETVIPFVLAARALGAWGVLPAFAGGGVLEVGARFESIELWIAGAGFAEQSVLSSRRGGGRFGLVFARVRGGIPLDVSPFELVPSVALELGSMWGSAFGVPEVQIGMATWVAVGIGADARVWLPLTLSGAQGSELGMSIAADLIVPLYRPAYVLRTGERDVLHQASEVGAYFGIGLIFRGR